MAGKKSHLALAVGLFAIVAVGGARAEVFFRPFGGVFHHNIEEEPPPAYVSRQAVARIVAREGFRLVGPLGSHGEQIVATGVDRRGRRMRFVIDPYEGEVLSARRLPDFRHDYEPAEPLPQAPEQGGYDEGAPPTDMGPRSDLRDAPERPAARRSRTDRAPDLGNSEDSGATKPGPARRAIVPPRPSPVAESPAPASPQAPQEPAQPKPVGGG